jgi:hypothetical protein
VFKNLEDKWSDRIDQENLEYVPELILENGAMYKGMIYFGISGGLTVFKDI